MKLFDENAMYKYLEIYLKKHNMKEAQKALIYAYECHKYQFRKGGDPYIIHPLTIACDALSMGLISDNLIATILLHDVVEDCDIVIEELPFNGNIKNSVSLLTFRRQREETKEEALQKYYDNIILNKNACITKLLDRKHNLSTMINGFSETKMEEYIIETKEFILPLLRKTKYVYPELSNFYHILKGFYFPVIDVFDHYSNNKVKIYKN